MKKMLKFLLLAAVLTVPTGCGAGYELELEHPSACTLCGGDPGPMKDSDEPGYDW